ncbi:DUF4153 domain-containing protein [Micromonospora sp. U21]|uniref:DUF4153 domain-containing protein n=1 Tax=Micromonospora sp. U21 TaxID=2824899 RepID=UPI001B39A0A2|nr:DUF4173 domain-containing protein [Micromonospora sp. U21]MBQ0903634.1 DUF4173 domain-containing protein [Micromonospora sp. U21]
MTSPASTPVPAAGPQPTAPGRPGQPWVGPGPALPPVAGRPQPWAPTPATPKPPSLLERRWPGPLGAARPVVLAALAAAAVVGASTLPVVRPGVGWLVAALAAAAALVTATVVRPATLSPATDVPDRTAYAPGDPATRATNAAPGAADPAPATARPGATGAPGRVARAVWAAATVALVAVGSVRAAGWLFALCLVAAAVTATLAVTGGRSPFGMLVAATLPPAATVRALPWAVRGLRRTRPAGAGAGRILSSLAVSAGLLTLFGLLFSSADAVFADLVAGLLPDISASGVIGWLARLLLIGGGLLGGAYLVSRPPDLEGLRPAPTRPAHRLEWALPLALLNALFAAFVLVQLTVFFGGAGHVLRTAGLTYAQYARGGFWQLLAVTALTLLVIAIAARRAPKATRADRLMVRALLGTLTVLSLIVVASALYRMQVYAGAYGATRLRLVVATVELWLGLLFVLVAAAVARLRADWLPRLVIGTAVLALLGLALVNPDRLIADRNVDRYLETGRLDVGYLSRLSADAVPALDRLPEPLRACALREIADELPRDGLWAANLGRERARRELGVTPAASATDCPGPLRW